MKLKRDKIRASKRNYYFAKWIRNLCNKLPQDVVHAQNTNGFKGV